LSKVVLIDKKIKSVFVEFLVDGIVNLYYYNEFGKEFFFLETPARS